ncbi:ornithine cyclodeaminase family protein [Halovenus sp. WSH3]|uniref:Ornithine cyclodeaminase family protein n=1 Tax=Halovenus carboxidivorans TaxID=2692199 RepID=A0A6B0T403_9EURY|nr:ornithine cyclodeaminase family protein [Halovenus carboxidivorans]MXR52814.1 ornithine cyclodeaminase family protein [Halovenus carboxidivorans]
MTLFLQSEEVADLATPAEYVEVVREGYRQRGEGAQAEPRTRLNNADPPGFLTGYFAILPETGAMGGYTYAAGFGQQDAQFVLPLFDAESGELLSIIDGASMNPWKTGAAGAVGIDELAREDATELGIIGSGTQARGQLHGAAAVRDLERVRVFSPTESNREAFAAEMDDQLDAAVEPVESTEQAVSDVDVLITATTATEPVFDGEDLSPGTHVTAMGSYHPTNHEVDPTTVARSKYVPDLRGRIDTDAGAYRTALEEGAIEEGHVHAELGEIVAGAVPGRESADEITLFDSGGTAIETVAAAKLLYDRAREKGLGETLDISSASEAFPGR